MAPDGVPATSISDGPTILLVDDNQDIITVTRRILEREHYPTLTATDGRTALELARSRKPDLILLDIMLPEIDGLEVCRRLKAAAETRASMILLITGRGSVDNLVEGLEAGADDYITKPFHLTELMARVKCALRIKHLNDEIEARNRELLQTQRERLKAEKMATIGLLATGIAHEFNNIMSGIAGFAQLAKRNPAYKDKLVEVAQTQAERALHITRSLATFYRPSGEIERTILATEIENALCLVAKRISDKDIEVVKRFDEVPPALAQPGQVQEVFLNLILNASQAIESEGTITLRVWGEDSEVLASVTDNGCGIPEKHLARIFDPFFTTKGALGGGRQPGSGLGLSVSYNIVRSFGGRLTVSSTVNEGTTFTLALPAGGDGHEERGGAPGSMLSELSPHGPDVKPSILIGDPDDCSREMVEDYLKNCCIASCTCWDEVHSRLRDHRYDFVIVDADLPGDGQLEHHLTAATSTHPEVPLLLTSSSYARDGVAPASMHLLKPYSMENLKTILNVGMRRPSARACAGSYRG